MRMRGVMRDVVCNGPELRVGSRDGYGVGMCLFLYTILIIIIFVMAKERKKKG